MVMVIIITIALFVICRAECEYQVKGHPRARYKKFNTEEEAQGFITQVIFVLVFTNDSKHLYSRTVNRGTLRTCYLNSST